jgi:1,4-alpha-glucan branching enzyme
LEFHKIRWPGGLKLWRVTDAHADLGAKRPYEPDTALGRVADHAAHFAHLLATIAADQTADGPGVIVAPFDTELLGHWWFEGVDFLGELYRRLPDHAGVQPVTAARYLDAHPSRTGLRLSRGSWGAGGDDRMWLNDGTVWTWRRLWALERAFWDAAPRALADPAAQPVLAQAAREMLLAQASDWQFIISTGAAADYAEQRFTLHCDAAERLTAALAPGATAEGAARLAADLHGRDDLFPDVLPAVAAAIAPR